MPAIDPIDLVLRTRCPAKHAADLVRCRYPLAAAVMDSQRAPSSSRYARFVRSLDGARVVRGIPSCGVAL